MTAGLTKLLYAVRDGQAIDNEWLRVWKPCGKAEQRASCAVLTDAGAELLGLLRIKAALERIAATGARYAIHHADPKEPPLSMSIRIANGTWAVGYSGPLGSRLTADLAEESAAWAEAQVAPKVAACKHCGKRCE